MLLVKYKIYKILQIFTIVVVLVFSPYHLLFAALETELRDKIEDHSNNIKKLEEEIATYKTQIEKVGTEAKTLQNAIKELDLNQKKVQVEIKKTETNITKSNLTLESLGVAIEDTAEKIDTNSLAIKESLSAMREAENQSIIEHILSDKSLSEILDTYESTNQFQSKIRERSLELSAYKEDLSNKKLAIEKEKQKLVYFKSDLGDKNKILANGKKEKNTLLTSTRNQEAEYKKIVAQKQADKERFEKELFEFESALKRSVDPNSFPSAGSSVLSWPLDTVFITQYFGKTVDAKRLYSSGTHNGIDFRASRGTPVKAALNGTVIGTGNTDGGGCYSYGKWVLIEHPNGLTSLYAHLDLIKVQNGERVETGQTISYSGQTGYATGPHLHFSLYASQGVEVQKYSSSKNCKNASIPVADKSAYLDPMKYF
ncbi:MAG: peptidoglycan DD-metalloendopeptidase family protein [Patescibacteria group bacterium]